MVSYYLINNDSNSYIIKKAIYMYILYVYIYIYILTRDRMDLSPG